MAKKTEPVAKYVRHEGPSTHEELEKNGITDVLQRDRLILAEAIQILYTTVTKDEKPIEAEPKPVESVAAFVYELSQIHDGCAFFAQLEGLATIMRGERMYREVCGAAVQMLKEKGVTQAEFQKFVDKHCKEVK